MEYKTSDLNMTPTMTAAETFENIQNSNLAKLVPVYSQHLSEENSCKRQVWDPPCQKTYLEKVDGSAQ